ncbi:hypothetical protein P4193_34225 [Pseudomonas aeruginosa]|nr:hypothetical protein [Pseudomonas aeruginosa]
MSASGWDCSLESFGQAQPAIRLGLRMIRGFREEDARRIEQVREAQPFLDARSRPTRQARRPGPGCWPMPAPCAVSPDTGTRRAGPSPASSRNCHCSPKGPSSKRARSACHCLRAARNC